MAAALDAMTQEDFDAPSWTPVGKDETYGRFMRIRHYDTYLHEHDIRDALGVPDRLDVAAIEAALPEVDAALGYIVGRKAALPDGSVVRFDLTGPVVRTYVVVVDGRAQVVEDPDLEPTVTLAMSDLVFLRLTGGRTEPGPHLGADLEIAGDQSLGPAPGVEHGHDHLRHAGCSCVPPSTFCDVGVSIDRADYVTSRRIVRTTPAANGTATQKASENTICGT